MRYWWCYLILLGCSKPADEIHFKGSTVECTEYTEDYIEQCSSYYECKTVQSKKTCDTWEVRGGKLIYPEEEENGND